MLISSYILTLFLYSALAVPSEKVKVLKWPKTYALEATRVSITSGLTENFKEWFTKKQSRIDYNDGTVISVLFADSDKYENGMGYEIHPEVDEDGDIVFECYATEGDLYDEIVPNTILPNPKLITFEFNGYSKVNNKTASKFVATEVDTKTETNYTIWATYERKSRAWIPVRYEIKEYSLWYSGLTKHEIWDFFNVDTNKKHMKDVFEIVDDYDCQTVEPEDDKIVKELKFINPDNKKHVEHVFNKFVNKHNKTYAHEHEVAMRKNIFRQNIRLIKETNRRKLSYKLAVNHFADRTPEEMKKYRGLLRRPKGKVGSVPFPYTENTLEELQNELPNEYDARIYGLVSTIKNQEECGSCWTFGTTAAVEGALAKFNGGKLISLSNQALVDCAWPYGASGCNGGSDNAAYEWMQDYGLPTEAEYGPYVNRDGLCNINNMTKTYPIQGFTDVTPNSIGALKVALVNHGPLSVSLDVSSEAFSFYAGGVFYDGSCDPKSLNHEVSLVGYGEKDDDIFWILRNSWGPQWGIDGYMHISARDNACGVTTEPTYVVF